MIPAQLRFVQLSLVGAFFVAIGSVRAEVRLPALFTHHLVLQQKTKAPVWGWADDGERITVKFRGREASTVARDGEWTIQIPTQKAGGPFTLVVEGNNRLTLTNVLVGEVWVCSGQSNMQWPMTRSFNPDAAIADSANPRLHLFTVPRLKADSPVNDVESAWVECGPDTVGDFSAVAYYFGRALERARQVPVGLIHTSWGGSPAEVWIRHEVLAAHPDYKRDILDAYTAQAERHQAELAKWKQEAEALRQEGKKPTRNQPRLGWKPCELYNGMIAPLLPYAICGAIWYQGESNAGRAYQYRSLFVDMIKNWRVDWDQGDFAFLAVQLAPWDKNRKRPPETIAAEIGESDWAELREAQLLATETLPKVGMVVITDYGDKDDIHPTQKEPVGERLALAARGIAYREKVVYSGPIFDKAKIKKGQAILSFEHVGSGLEARGGRLRGFTLCGSDRRFVTALAEIDREKIVVSSPLVPEPVAVRYGWADYPMVNLFNREGLPASPFRTDDFPLTTAPKD